MSKDEGGREETKRYGEGGKEEEVWREGEEGEGRKAITS